MISIAKDIKKKKVAELWYLNILALKYIFDKAYITKEEERLIENSIEGWIRKVDLTPYEKKELNVIITCLIHNKEGRFDNEKFAYKKGDIDYRKVYRGGI